MVTFDTLQQNADIRAYIQRADESLAALGFTEHSFAHVMKVANEAAALLDVLGYDPHTVELTRIAGYLHDIGNLINRVDHSQSGAIMAFRLLDKMGMPAEDIATVILADKSDVRRSRVRNRDFATFDIHDRVNYSVEGAKLSISEAHTEVLLALTIDTAISSVMDYFEIFLGRMILCRKAAECLHLKFRLQINRQNLL